MAADPAPASATSASELLSAYQRLANLLRLILRERDMESVLDRIADALGELVYADDIVVWESAGEELQAALAKGRDADIMRGITLRHGVGITGLCALTRRPILSNNAEEDPRAEQVPGTPHDPEAIICVPLLVEEKLLGVLSLYRAGTTGFTEAEFELAGRFADLVAVAIDAARTQAMLEALATTDELTDIANRRRFQEEFERELAAADRYGGCLSLLLLDLDDFKQVNDTHGHATGDEVLQAVARALGQRVRRGDLAARLGGDEFAVLLPQADEAEAGIVIADLKRAIAEETAVVPVTASFGSATFHPGEKIDLMDAADKLLYAAKRARAAAAPGA